MDSINQTPPVPALPLNYGGPPDVTLRARQLIWALAGILAWSAINSLAMIMSFFATLVGAALRLDPQLIGGIATAAQFLTIIIVALILFAIFSSNREMTSGAAIFLGVSALILALAAAAMQVLGQAFIVQMVSPSGFGRISIVRSLAYMIWTPLMPVIAMVLILWLRGRTVEQR